LLAKFHQRHPAILMERNITPQQLSLEVEAIGDNICWEMETNGLFIPFRKKNNDQPSQPIEITVDQTQVNGKNNVVSFSFG